MRSSAGDTLSQLCVWHVLPRTALPLAPPLPSIASAAAGAALFGDFIGTMGESDFPWPYIIALRVRPCRCGPPGTYFPNGQPEVSDHAGSGWGSPWRPSPCCLPLISTGTLDGKLFAAQYSARVFPYQR